MVWWGCGFIRGIEGWDGDEGELCVWVGCFGDVVVGCVSMECVFGGGVSFDGDVVGEFVGDVLECYW